jgi:hypothetical protein
VREQFNYGPWKHFPLETMVSVQSDKFKRFPGIKTDMHISSTLSFGAGHPKQDSVQLRPRHDATSKHAQTYSDSGGLYSKLLYNKIIMMHVSDHFIVVVVKLPGNKKKKTSS